MSLRGTIKLILLREVIEIFEKRRKMYKPGNYQVKLLSILVQPVNGLGID